MKKEQQDLAWACLPNDARNQIISSHFCKRDSNTEYNKGYVDAILQIYGINNLTSDTEPEEMLMVDRKKIQELYARFDKYQKEATMELDKDFYKGEQNALVLLFGDKCLSDKEQPKPKLSKGERVKIINVANPMLKDEIGIIKALPTKDESRYEVGIDDGWTLLESKYLEPYTEEPETKSKEAKETQNLSLSDEQATENKEPMEEKELGKEDNFPTKELNLCELLKGCEKHKFYSPMLGDAFIVQIRETSIHIVPCDEEHCERFLFIDKCGIWTKGGQCILYPSRALYEKYPLDAYSAWMEWARKPKRWRAKEGEQYFLLNPDGEVMVDNECYFDIDSYRHDFGNYFRTQEEAQQASEVVKEALVKFHEQNVEK